MAALTKAQLANLRSMRENDVETAICDFLRLHRWRVQRNQSGLFQRPGSRARVRIGEKGMFDWEAIRPVGSVDRSFSATEAANAGVVDFFYLETKRPGGKITVEQATWAREVERRGIATVVADSLEGFQNWYFARYPYRDPYGRRRIQ